ncbi:MAG: galactose mutarotase [Clostridiales bacterium]|nr:galactose mutarotase [Clostridiales bacterium]
MSIEKNSFSFVENREAFLYTLKNKSGASVSVTDFGATTVKICVPDKNGVIDDIALGYDSAMGYMNGTSSQGGTIGRYANRIAPCGITAKGVNYKLALNDGGNCTLHGGNISFNKRFWNVVSMDAGENPSITFEYVSPNGEENFPGTVVARVTYTFTENNELKLFYEATTDDDTYVNLTNHTYFNLKGYGKGDVLSHEVTINAIGYTPVNSIFIPTGEVKPVKDTVFDFTSPKAIAKDLFSGDKELEAARGYDHNFVLGEPHVMRNAAKVYEPSTGRVLEVITDKPAMQLYIGNFLDSTETGKEGIKFAHRTGFCLETQYSPDSPNQKSFYNTLLKPGEKYEYTTIFKFYAE